MNACATSPNSSRRLTQLDTIIALADFRRSPGQFLEGRLNERDNLIAIRIDRKENGTTNQAI